VPEKGSYSLIALYISSLMTFFFVSIFLGSLEKNPTKIWGANPPLLINNNKTDFLPKYESLKCNSFVFIQAIKLLHIHIHKQYFILSWILLDITPFAATVVISPPRRPKWCSG
jgi:hypothetical protein